MNNYVQSKPLGSPLSLVVVLLNISLRPFTIEARDQKLMYQRHRILLAQAQKLLYVIAGYCSLRIRSDVEHEQEIIVAIEYKIVISILYE